MTTPTYQLINLPQYLDDHTHLPTLRKLPRSLPIVANPGAADVIRPLGFSNVKVLMWGGYLAGK